MTRQALAIGLICTFAVLSAPVWAASENYPVTYPGGTPPGMIVGALDADDDSMAQRPVSCSAVTTNTTGHYAYDTVTFTNTGANVANVTFAARDLNDQCTTSADTVVVVYSGAFNPATPLANCQLVVNDDTVGAPCSTVNFQVPAGNTKIVVITSNFAGLPRPGPEAPEGGTGLFGYHGGFGGTTPVTLQSFTVDQGK